ncbi:hypothetical protein V8F20_012376 [Naviculisporaceae sp. PSN 640]
MDVIVQKHCTPDRLSTSALLSVACQLSLSSTTITTTDERIPHLDPEKTKYIFQLLRAIYHARFIAGCYNVAVLMVILVIGVFHWRRTRKDRMRWRARVSRIQASRERQEIVSSTGESSSSGSSTIEGNTTPPDSTAKIVAGDVDPSAIDVERLPLLPNKTRQKHQTTSRIRKCLTAFRRRLASFLTYQPAPIPIINRTLPQNSTSLFITTFLLLNIFFLSYGLPLTLPFFFVFATKCGLMFVVNLPLLYLLSAKNQPLRRITGYSYEGLNIFHRRLGEWMCLLAVVHFTAMVLFQFYIAEDWLRQLTSPGGPKEYFSHPVILYGLGALVAYETLFFTSLGSFRQRWYEIFLASHVGLQIAGLVFVWFHFHTSRLYVGLSLVIFLVDRLVWRLGVKKTSMMVDLAVMEDGRTVMLSGDWDIPVEGSDIGGPSRRWSWVLGLFGIRRKSVLYGWKPADHVFLTVPVLGRSHALQAHPFTIASAAPQPLSESDETRHAWLSLLIRAQDGFTEELLRYAQAHSRVEVRLDGPYGSSHTLDMLRASDCVILVAGGSGIAVTFPLAWALLSDRAKTSRVTDVGEDYTQEEDKLNTRHMGMKKRRSKQCIHLIWLTHSRSHRSWIPQDRLDEMVEMGLDLVVPEPTEGAGRPDVAGLVEGWIRDSSSCALEESDGERPAVGVVCSGPDGLNRLVRNVCADVIGGGLGDAPNVDVKVAVEKFGW